MKIEVSKKSFFITLGIFLLLAGFFVVRASVNENLPWHSASQVKMANGNDLETEMSSVKNDISQNVFYILSSNQVSCYDEKNKWCTTPPLKYLDRDIVKPKGADRVCLVCSIPTSSSTCRTKFHLGNKILEQRMGSSQKCGINVNKCYDISDVPSGSKFYLEGQDNPGTFTLECSRIIFYNSNNKNNLPIQF